MTVNHNLGVRIATSTPYERRERQSVGFLPPVVRHNDWLSAQARKYSEKDLAVVAHISVKSAEHIRSGRNAIQFAHLVEWCRNDPAFAAAFAEHVGLILPGSAEFTAAMTLAIGAYQRMRGAE